MTPVEREQFFSGIRSSADRLRRLRVGPRDGLAAAGRRHALPGQELYGLPELVRGTAARRASTGQGVHVEVMVPDDSVVEADEVRLSQALDNLLDNAVRHGAAPIAMTARLTEDHVEVRVTDAGARSTRRGWCRGSSTASPPPVRTVAPASGCTS